MVSIFKNDLLSLSNTQLVNKYYLSGGSFALDDSMHHQIREKVANHFQVDFSKVFLVGSAKLGFSIKPKRRFLPFRDESDIDIVIISQDLYERIWQELYSFERNGGYWEQSHSFKEYHFKGWMRPDKLPLETSFIRTRMWWDFFEGISGSGEFGPYRIRGGLYHSRFFFENYQNQCFEQCRTQLNNENFSN
ncbi:hypothetical protein IC235_06385 [Hymenobacter sp. BT664]|uniref:Uncharacterized protein n=1 Tax=Hymenobacter montanus TaxID=2771359 RepID=A0A927GIX0_9BACT|nr:hypothetical protein [Hymenobacter montanus]MBD2767516.1 hypothetical protein [Hymenobacter montanus]